MFWMVFPPVFLAEMLRSKLIIDHSFTVKIKITSEIIYIILLPFRISKNIPSNKF